MTIGENAVLAGLLNTMLGGSMLVLPIAAMTGGYLIWATSAVLLGLIQGYNAYLLVKHLGKANTIEEFILNHFENNTVYLKIYSIVVWFSFVSAMVLYFPLFCSQIQGLLELDMPYLPEMAWAFIVLWALMLRKCEIDDFALAIGISSIIGFLAFIAWQLYAGQTGVTDPSLTNPGGVAAVGSDLSTIILTIINMYTTQDFLMQMMAAYPNPAHYTRITVRTYVIGIVMVLFICGGSWGKLAST